MKNRLLYLTFCILALSSCIKDEPLNREADIVSFKIDEKDMVSVTITEDEIQLVVGEYTDYTNLSPEIEVSPGAIVSPESGTPIDFTNTVIYTVTSQDHNWQKDYHVKVTRKINLKQNFDNWKYAGTAYKYPALEDIMWGSANPGIMLAKVGKIDYYPTRDTTLAVSGKAALLETQKGGTYWFNYISIFSGSLFRGIFTLNTDDFVKSAKFGQPHPKDLGKPVTFTGYYMYTPGKNFLDDKGKVVPGKVDEFSIYSILYKVKKGDEGKSEYLDGTNILTSDKIVAKAIVEDKSAKDSFTKFTLPFVYLEEIDYDKYDYKLAVVLASSKDGDFYEGAPGSRLIVDEIEVICEAFKE